MMLCMVGFRHIGIAVARKWIAGTAVDDAVKRCKQINKRNVSGIINFLGENISDKNNVNDVVKTYKKLIDEIAKKKAKAEIAIKPTQIGLSISYSLALKNYIDIVKYAKKKGIFIWFDMEKADIVSDTISLYNQGMSKGYKNIGICIQSYLRRSEKDLKALDKSAVIRLVKGAYVEKPTIAFKSRKETTENYIKLMKLIFARFKRFTIATHDSEMVDISLSLEKRYKRNLTHAVLLGIRNDMAYRLAEQGHTASIYIPFGPDWLPYATRRLKERQNAKLFLRSLISK